MNVLKRTFVLSVKAGAQWEEIIGTNEIVSALFRNYRRIVVVLGSTLDDSERIVDLEQLRSTYILFNNTLNILIQSLDGYGFEVLDKLPAENVGYVHYASAHWAGYSINYAKAGVEYPKGTSVDLLTDVSIQRGDMVDNSVIHDYCLCTVNGYIHNTEIANGVTYLKDAGKSMRISDSNQLGIMSWLDVGKLTKFPITASMLSVMTGFQSMAERTKITVPEMYIGKPCFLVLGGYLIMPDGLVFSQISDRGYMLDLEKAKYIDKLLESQLYIDLSSLGLTPSDVNPGAIDVVEAKTDAVIQRYLTLSQSFIVFVDTDSLFWDRIPVKQTKSPGLFVTCSEPTYPLMLGDGRLCDYWKQEQRGRWAMTMVDSYRRLWMHHRESGERLRNIFAQLSFDAGNRFDQGALLEIGSYHNGSM